MNHSMTVRAYKGNVFNPTLALGGQFGKRHRMMAFDESLAKVAIRCSKIKRAHGTRQATVALHGTLSRAFDKILIPFARPMEPKEDFPLREDVFFVLQRLLNLI